MNSIAEINGTGNFEFESLRHARAYRHALVQEFAPHLGKDVLEIGAGIGQITELLLKAPGVEKIRAVEPNPKFCVEFRKHLPHIPIVEGIASSLQSDHATSLVCINVLEHIERDDEELRTYASLLRPAAGHLCLFVPARPEIYSPLDADFGHYRRYTRPDLKSKIEAAGFKILRFEYFNFIGYFAWWLNFCLLRQRRFHVASVVLFDRMIFPLMHFFESKIVRPPFGQSLLVVAKAR